MIKNSTTPHLTTTLTGPLKYLEKCFLDQQVAIESWFRQAWSKTPAPLYTSVDLRNAGFKLAPVDTNLFPAGFNNLNQDFLPLCVQAAQATIAETCPDVTRLLLIPESHSRNAFYYESLFVIVDIFKRAGFEVRIGSLDKTLQAPKVINLSLGKQLHLEPLRRDGDAVGVGDFFPCCIILNNDLSDGVPSILEGISQKIRPLTQLGWATRLKSQHFGFYEAVATEFSELLGIDPWLINPLFDQCDDVDFMDKSGHDCIKTRAFILLEKIKLKYAEHGITQRPFLVIKADAGTYGMAVMTIHDVSELSALNRKQRTRMSKIKGGGSVTKAIIQEGVYTFETVGTDQAVAEPVVYMIGRHVVGGFYRIHQGRGPSENLNAPGMAFHPLAFEKVCQTPSESNQSDNRFYAYGVIARLAALAAARELALVQS